MPDGHLQRLAPGVAEHLGYYVYMYVDPRTSRPFYVGKGKGNRVLAHLSASGESRKARVMAELKAQGKQPRLEILAHALPSEASALRIEAAVIDDLGLDDLTNIVSGWKTVKFGRAPLEELVALYGAKPVTIEHPVLLIRINRRWRFGMSIAELYDATRCSWKLGGRRQGARYALAVYHSVVREVFRIDSWHPAGTTERLSSKDRGKRVPRRWEFTGDLAPAGVRERYRGRSVGRYLRQGSQNPTRYVNC